MSTTYAKGYFLTFFFFLALCAEMTARLLPLYPTQWIITVTHPEDVPCACWPLSHAQGLSERCQQCRPELHQGYD